MMPKEASCLIVIMQRIIKWNLGSLSEEHIIMSMWPWRDGHATPLMMVMSYSLLHCHLAVTPNKSALPSFQKILVLKAKVFQLNL